MAATRGAPAAQVKSGIIESDTVGMPAASISRWASPTDRQQNGQTGAKSARSTESDRIPSMIAGTLVRRNSSGRRR